MSERTDRELLELAAKAACIQLEWNCDSPVEVFAHWNGNPNEPPEKAHRDWNPLTDDGDALRLAVALHMTVTAMTAFCGAKPNFGGQGIDLPTLGEDRGAVLRRAIVMVAAEIGANMQS